MDNDRQTLPEESSARKALPVTTGVIDYFPAALAEVAKVSKYGNDKHNPGQPLHHARGKSMDHADAIGRHLIDRGKIDPDTGVRHSAELAWRALALLQQELEDAGLAPLARGAIAAKPTYTAAERDDQCGDEGPDGWYCERERGHDGKHWFNRAKYTSANDVSETWA